MDVLIGLSPIIVVSLIIFRQYAAKQIGICVASCCLAEFLFTMMRRRPFSLGDLSAVVTGVILAMSLPAECPLFVGVIGSFAAMGLGKMIFGGVGFNLFNPAMVGRAFAMLTFTLLMGAASGYVVQNSGLDVLTQATPMTALKEDGVVTNLLPLLLGNTNGSLGETSALACIVGGLFLCYRRTASWEIPLGMLLSVGIIAGVLNILNPHEGWNVLHSLLGGAVLFGAFFIATDPVSSPLTQKGKIIFGVGVGAFVMIIRKLSGYPEGVMFAVLLMNALTPLINRWTIPKPLGGAIPVPVKK